MTMELHVRVYSPDEQQMKMLLCQFCTKKWTNICSNVEIIIIKLDIMCKQNYFENMCSMLGCLTIIHINIESKTQGHNSRV
jgi:hypothetical protein